MSPQASCAGQRGEKLVRQMTKIRPWIVGAAILGFAYVAGVATNAQEAPRPLVAHHAVGALIGNTLVYAKPDQSGVERAVFLWLDGTGRAVTRGPDGANEPRIVRWVNLSDGQFCVTDVGRKSWEGDCGILTVDGGRATLAPKTGPVWTGQVLEGDAWKLDPARSSGESFVGKAAIKALVGNTIIFIPQGGSREYRAQYFGANGTVRQALNDQPDFDHWALLPDDRWSIRGKDDQLCFSGRGVKEVFCATISIAGDLVTLRHARVGLLHAKLARGDARNLSPAVDAANRKLAAMLVNKTLLLKATDRQARTDSRIYFQRGGAGLAKWGDRAIEPMQWLLQRDGKLCAVRQRAKFQDSDCFKLSIDGDAVILQAPDRPAIPGRLIKGKALKM